MAGQYSFSIEQGATFKRTITWKDESNTPVDLTDFTARMKIKEGSRVIASLVSPSDITLGGISGTIEITISASDTTAMNFDTANYDLELVNGETVKRLLSGVVSLAKEMTT